MQPVDSRGERGGGYHTGSQPAQANNRRENGGRVNRFCSASLRRLIVERSPERGRQVRDMGWRLGEDEGRVKVRILEEENVWLRFMDLVVLPAKALPAFISSA